MTSTFLLFFLYFIIKPFSYFSYIEMLPIWLQKKIWQSIGRTLLLQFLLHCYIESLYYFTNSTDVHLNWSNQFKKKKIDKDKKDVLHADERCYPIKSFFNFQNKIDLLFCKETYRFNRFCEVGRLKKVDSYEKTNFVSIEM